MYEYTMYLLHVRIWYSIQVKTIKEPFFHKLCYKKMAIKVQNTYI